MPEDYYRTLDVSREATPEEIQRSYRSLARRYHPDRNSAPAAAAVMAAINEAYEILSEPDKRASYNLKYQKRDDRIDDTILQAAKANLLKRNWKVVEEDRAELLLKEGSRRVFVALTPSITSSIIRRCLQKNSGFCVVLTVRTEFEIRVPPSMAVIDLMHSRLCAGNFPDSVYQNLFQVFLSN